MITKIISAAAAKGFNAGDAIGVGLNTFGAYQDYKTSREDGGSVPVSVAKGLGTVALGEVLGGWGTLAYFGVTAGVKGAIQMGEVTTKQMQQGYKSKGFLGSGYLPMGKAGYTMRQRSMSAIQQNASNVSSLFGNEARTYFRGAGY